VQIDAHEMTEKREALCYACPAAPCTSEIGSAVYCSVEALKQHRARRHNKMHDVGSYMSLETLNLAITSSIIQRVVGIQSVAGGIWAPPCSPVQPREPLHEPPPPEFRVISLFEDRSGILTKYTKEDLDAHRKLFEVRIVNQERLFMTQALSFLECVEAKASRVDFFMKRLMKRDPDGRIPTKGFQALNTKKAKQ
jgi:hypothetical protein